MEKRNKLIEYKEAGAWMRLCKDVISKTELACCMVLNRKDTALIEKAAEKIASACSRAEDNMFSDYPDLTTGSADIFYGTLEARPRTDIDSEQIELAKELIINLFGKNWDDVTGNDPEKEDKGINLNADSVGNNIKADKVEPVEEW